MLTAGWFYKPEYICNDLAVNSAIGYPLHDEVVPLTQPTYTVRGYAYCGEPCWERACWALLGTCLLVPLTQPTYTVRGYANCCSELRWESCWVWPR